MNVQISKIFSEKNKIVQSDKDFTSSQMSDLARYIGYALAAVTITFFNSDSTFAKALVSNFTPSILLTSIFGCVAIFLDYLQYFFGYLNSKRAAAKLKESERLGVQEHWNVAKVSKYRIYDSKAVFYSARLWCFYAKTVSVAIGASIFISILVRDLIR